MTMRPTSPAETLLSAARSSCSARSYIAAPPGSLPCITSAQPSAQQAGEALIDQGDEELVLAAVLLHLEGQPAGEPAGGGEGAGGELHGVEADADGPHVHRLRVHRLPVVDLWSRVL